MIRAVIFDFDDTLIRTKDISFEKHASVGKEFGYTISEDVFWANYGKPWPVMIDNIFPGLPFSIFYEKLIEVERDHIFKEVDGALATLKKFHEEGFLLGILTSDLRESFLRRAHRLGFLPYLQKELIFCADDLAYPKPDPRAFDPILHYLQAKGVQQHEIAFIGDLLLDFETVKSSSVSFFGVTTGVYAFDDFVKSGLSSSSILLSVAELPSHLLPKVKP